MVIRMAQPWVHPITKMIYLRQRTPEDMHHLAGGKVSLPVGGSAQFVTIRDMVQLSLRTKDPDDGKQRHAKADAALRQFWASKRREREASSQIRLTPPPTMAWSDAVARFGPSTSIVLGQEDVADTDANRGAIIAETASIFDAVASKLNPDAGMAMVAGVSDARKPTSRHTNLSGVGPANTSVQITVDKLWELFVRGKTDVLARKTIYRYSSTLTSLNNFCHGKSIADVSDDDVFAWAKHRRDADKIKPGVINRNDLAAVRSVFGWATTHQGGKLLKTNPAQGIRLDAPRRSRTREPSFREAEVRAILSAALSVNIGGDNISLAHAKRWCPWLDAYSGCRISELTALETSDVRQEQGVWVYDLDMTKTRMPRIVPIHQHLIEQGFLKFVEEIGSGPLFYDPTRVRNPDALTLPAELRAQDLAEWVREVADLSPELDPNHGWRHTFKSRALDIMDPKFGITSAGTARQTLRGDTSTLRLHKLRRRWRVFRAIKSGDR